MRPHWLFPTFACALLVVGLAGPAAAQTLDLDEQYDQRATGLGIDTDGAGLAARFDGLADGSGSFQLDGIPREAEVRKAWLYWSITGGDTGVTAQFEDSLVQGRELVDIEDSCFVARTRVYRADVTDQVDGPGRYSVSQLPSSTDGADTNGASLLAVYGDDDAERVGRVVLQDGGILAEGDATAQLADEFQDGDLEGWSAIRQSRETSFSSDHVIFEEKSSGDESRAVWTQRVDVSDAADLRLQGRMRMELIDRQHDQVTAITYRLRDSRGSVLGSITFYTRWEGQTGEVASRCEESGRGWCTEGGSNPFVLLDAYYRYDVRARGEWASFDERLGDIVDQHLDDVDVADISQIGVVLRSVGDNAAAGRSVFDYVRVRKAGVTENDVGSTFEDVTIPDSSERTRFGIVGAGGTATIDGPMRFAGQQVDSHPFDASDGSAWDDHAWDVGSAVAGGVEEPGWTHSPGGDCVVITTAWTSYAIPDSDGDGVVDTDDNCPETPNADQADFNDDGRGDVCSDTDGDGRVDARDNCPAEANPDQTDSDDDGIGDACSTDPDGDGVLTPEDNCPRTANPEQRDFDDDGEGNVCDDDIDGDGVPNDEDNCPRVRNPDQRDTDDDGYGDKCDTDDDGDGVDDPADNCPKLPNPAQRDLDADGVGDKCDDDVDGDGIPQDGDGLGGVGNNPCDASDLENCDDNCPRVPNPTQTDSDDDGTGDACDPESPGPGSGCGGCTTTPDAPVVPTTALLLLPILLFRRLHSRHH